MKETDRMMEGKRERGRWVRYKLREKSRKYMQEDM